MNLDLKTDVVTCPRCGVPTAEVIYVVEMDGEYLFCQCGVFRILSQ